MPHRDCGGERTLTQGQVEPQEKKKSPKGRARKRMVYIRRFVNVAMTGGKRKVRNDHPTITTGLTEADEPQPDDVVTYQTGRRR
jgi:hypothetical protein